MKRIIILLLVAAASFALALGAQAGVKKAKGAIELTDPAGDVNNINSSSGKSYPGFDVVKLAITSDGKQIKFTTTLKDPPGNFASSVLDIYFDTDNDPKTGTQLMFFKDKGGFTHRSKLTACIKYDNGATACVGGSSKAKPMKRFGAMGLYQLIGEKESKKKEVVSAMGFPGKKKGKRIPIKGTVVEGVLDYEDLGVKSGQTIRILMREASSDNIKGSLFPEVLLTLK